jgi:hypothetical protein
MLFADHWRTHDQVLRHQVGVRRKPVPYGRGHAPLTGRGQGALHCIHRPQDPKGQD